MKRTAQHHLKWKAVQHSETSLICQTVSGVLDNGHVKITCIAGVIG